MADERPHRPTPATEEHPQQDPQARGAQPREPQAPERAPQTAEKSPDQVRAEYDERMEKERAEAQDKLDHPPMIGTRRTVEVPPNTPQAQMPAGPMSLLYAVGGLKIFQHNGRRYEVLSEMGGGVLVVNLMESEPKTVMFMRTPGTYESTPE